MKEIIGHRGYRAGEKTPGSRSTREYFVAWDGFNVEDFTWEKEKDVLATTAGGDGADELVEEYFARLKHEKSRQTSRDDGTAELTEVEIDEIAETLHVSMALMATMSMPEAHEDRVRALHGECRRQREAEKRDWEQSQNKPQAKRARPATRVVVATITEKCTCERCDDAWDCAADAQYQWSNRRCGNTEDWQPVFW